MKNISIKNKYEAWSFIGNRISDCLPTAITEAKEIRSCEKMLVCALLKQVLKRIRVRLASDKYEFTISFTYPEAMAIHQGYQLLMLWADIRSYEGFLLLDMYSKIDKEAF